MSNLTQNDVLETGMEINDVPDDSPRLDSYTLLTASRKWSRIKVYVEKNFSAWKTTMTVLTIIELIILLYLAEFAGQIRNLNGKKI